MLQKQRFMVFSFAARLRLAFLIPTALSLFVFSNGLFRNDSASAQSRLYTPIPFQPGNQVRDRLSTRDIPTGQGGFARDYVLTLSVGDQIAIDLASDEFDTIVMLMDTEGNTIVENDDGPDGSTNSLLFTRIAKSGTYIVRVRAFGESAGGTFTLKITRLKPV
ncbi:MAG: PPC domain-containing protein [Leptolyngbyaceae cyanobacterium bins.59]|nr:PPC domain-containing protein [Leptolyngbyaceae cyanobacterium bins.59]